MLGNILCFVILLPATMSCTPVRKVGIVGCGIFGLTMGLSLKCMCPNVEVSVADCRADIQQSESGGGIQISAGGVILDKLIGYSNLVSNGLPLSNIRARNEKFDELLNIDLQTTVTHTIMRNTLMSVLYNLTMHNVSNDDQQTPKICITESQKCVAVTENALANKITLTFDNDSFEDDYDLVIGADGVSSTVRSYIEAGSNNENSFARTVDSVTDRTGLRITYCVTPPGLGAIRKSNHNALHQWFGDGTYALTGSYGGLQGVQHMLAVVYRSSEPAPLSQNPGWDASRTNALSNDLLRRLQQAGLGDNPELLSLLEASMLPGGRTIDLSVRDTIVPLKSWSSASGRVILIGDSAHPTSPFLGQGANQAMQDAYCLATLIRDYNTQQATISSTRLASNGNALKRMALKYEGIRKPPTALVSVESRILGELETLSGPLGRVVKENFFRAMGSTGIAKMVYMMGTVPRVHGNGLNIEEFSGLEVAMLQRKLQENLDGKMFFWGKIFGTTQDYLIVHHIDPFADFPEKKYYFCTTSDFVLRAVPYISDEYANLASKIRIAFTGDPSFFAYNGEEEEPEPEDPDAPPVERFREVHRLAFTVKKIDRECALVPRGALSLDTGKKVIPNSNYQGLSYETSTQLRAYLHLRQPESLQGIALMKRPGILKTDDFLDCIDKDLPKEMWAVSHDSSASTVHVRNLYWDGFAFYAVLKSTEYGAAYFGNGVPNYDIAFML